MTTRPQGPRADDDAAVTALLGRSPSADFHVVVRREDGAPVVIENAPFLRDGTPMPTRFWLVDGPLCTAVARLEAHGGVRAAEAAVDPAELADAHRRYGLARDALVAPGHLGPRPAGGVGGTRTGVKCLHAHLASWLAGADDPVGAWVAGRLGVRRGPGTVRDDGASPPTRARPGAGPRTIRGDREEGS